MADATIKPTTFSTGPSDSLTVEDAYDSGGISGLNVDAESTFGLSGFGGLPVGSISEIKLDTGLDSVLSESGMTLSEAIRNVRNDLPPNASLTDVLKSNNLSDVIVATKRIATTMDPAALGKLTGDEMDFLIAETGKLTNSVIIRDGKLTLDNLKDASGFDYVVMAAVGVMVVRQVMTSEGREDLLGMIADTKLPGILKDAALESIMDLAAEYGLEGVVGSLINILGERLTKTKRKKTIKQLLKGFRFTDKPIISELSVAEKELVTSASSFFGADEGIANLLGETAEGLYQETSYPTKRQQAASFVKTLYKTDSKWNSAKRAGTTIPLLDMYEFASKDAITALALDSRTVKDILIQRGRNVKPESWKRTAKKQYPRIYL